MLDSSQAPANGRYSFRTSLTHSIAISVLPYDLESRVTDRDAQILKWLQLGERGGVIIACCTMLIRQPAPMHQRVSLHVHNVAL